MNRNPPLFLATLALVPALALAQAPDPAPRPYASVIPASATTQRGFLTVHRVGPKVYLEINTSRLGADMILAMRDNVGFWSQRTIRWERHGDRVLLRAPIAITSNDSSYAEWIATRRDDRSPVEAQFPVEAYGTDSAAVIDVTRLFIGGVAGLSPVQGQVDERRSVVLATAAYPHNVIVEALNTVTPPPAGPQARPSAQTYTLHWSLIKLPERPMRPRLHDERAGYFTVRAKGLPDQFGYGSTLDSMETQANIIRWRLEKKDPRADVSEPVQPIVMYLDPGTPAKWRKWVRAGIEEWLPAFEAAGLRNAIQVRDVPASDPNWSMDDVRHAMVYWREPTARDAKRLGGGSVAWITDDRTGEILRADVQLGAGVTNLGTAWYFAQAGGVDPAAQRLPLPDSIAGRMLQFVVSHEFGHALGLQDGSYGQFAYPVDSVRNRSFVRRMGHSPSILNYARVNYVAQPQDSIPPFDLVQKVGPADVHQIRWGYTEFSGNRDAERQALNTIAREQDTRPWLRFLRGDLSSRGLPYTNDANDDADPVRSTGFGLENLKRIMGHLQRATLQPGQDNRELESYYEQVQGQWLKEMRRLVDMIAGFTVQYKAGDQPGAVFVPVDAARQRLAMRFLDSTAFKTPVWLVDLDVARRYEANGAVARMVSMQTDLVAGLFDLRRLHRLSEAEITAANPGSVYSLSEMSRDVRQSIWSELTATSVRIDGWRQGLQQGMILVFRDLLGPDPKQEESFRMMGSRAGDREREPHLSAFERSRLRAELTALREEIGRAATRAADDVTRAHLSASLDLIDRILDRGRVNGQ